MPSSDWRSPAEYAYADRIATAGFAWEYLRRDDNYHRDFERVTAQQPIAEDMLDAFSDHWGLRFPERPRYRG